MDFDDDGLSIKDLIRAVTHEVLGSQAERIAAGDPAVFEVSELSLEISFVATTSKKAGGGFTLSVIKADGSVKYDAQSTHTVTLKLNAVDQPFGAGKVRPRLQGFEPK